jgi:hypothetical protein
MRGFKVFLPTLTQPQRCAFITPLNREEGKNEKADERRSLLRVGGYGKIKNVEKRVGWFLFGIAADEGDGIFPGVGEGDSQLIQAQALGLTLCLAIEIDHRPAAGVRQYLNLSQADARGGFPQGFYYRFLGSKTGSQ